MVYKVLNDTDMRRFYMLLLPQMSAEQQEHCLCCKRKAKGNKFRFSLDASKITKRGNPSYIGKMKESSKGFYEVKLSTNQLVMTIRVAGTEVVENYDCHSCTNHLRHAHQGKCRTPAPVSEFGRGRKARKDHHGKHTDICSTYPCAESRE